MPYHDFIKAMLHDLNRLSKDLEQDTRNVLLTYARIWSTLETSAIRSKSAAANWAMSRLPKAYQPVIERANLIYIGAEDEYWSDIRVLIKPCTDFMVNKINANISSINFDDPNKLIKLFDEPFSEGS